MLDTFDSYTDDSLMIDRDAEYATMAESATIDFSSWEHEEYSEEPIGAGTIGIYA